MKVTIYTDGSVKNNGKPNSYGGWAALLLIEGTTRRNVISGGKKPTTNNEMEMTAIIESLKTFDPCWAGRCEIEVISDSKYCVDTLSRWAWSWEKMGWRDPHGELVKNVELVKEAYALTKLFKVKYRWVKGHAANEFNNFVDELAGAETRKFERGVENVRHTRNTRK